MITVVVAHVVDDRVVVRQCAEARRLGLVVETREAFEQGPVRRPEPVDVKIDLEVVRGEEGQQLLAVVGDARPLRVERAEESDS